MKKIRYTRQNNFVDCAPVAILNSLKFKGYRASAKRHLPAIRESLGTTRRGGTPNYIIKETLGKMGARIISLRLPEIREELKKGNIVLASVDFKTNYHVILITGYKHEHYIVVNYYYNETISEVHYNRLRMDLSGTFCFAYSIKPDQIDDKLTTLGLPPHLAR